MSELSWGHGVVGWVGTNDRRPTRRFSPADVHFTSRYVGEKLQDILMVNSNITLISRYALEHFDKIMLLQRDLAHYVFACFFVFSFR
jgi:hypothetical protein